MDEKTNFLNSLEKALQPNQQDNSQNISPQPNHQVSREKESKLPQILNKALETLSKPFLEIILFYITLMISVAAIIKSSFYEETLLLIIAMSLQIIIIVTFLTSLQPEQKLPQ